MMDWDKIRAARKFLQKANAIHPEEIDAPFRAQALALQNVYYDCYMSSFSREVLISRLRQIVEGKIEMPEEETLNALTYRETCVKEAALILSSIEKGDFKF